MSVIGSNILAGASGQGGGYSLTKSLRFRSSASAYLNRTPAIAGNKQIFTVSFWLKTAKSNFDYYLFEASTDGGNNERTVLAFNSGKLQFRHIDGGSAVLNLETTQVFRDPSAWYHIVLAVDTTQATSSNRVKMYLNGSQITAFGTASYPTQNLNTDWNGANAHSIGSSTVPDSYADMYLAEFYNIDGQALTPSSFGETSTTTGVWIPKKYTGTYGTNGFYLPFTDTTSTSTLGTDFSGNSNTWTVNNISLTSGSTYDSMTDVPTLTSATTANYCVLNPLNVNLSAGSIGLSDGNLTKANNGNGAIGTILSSSDKYYCEIVYTAISGTAELGVCDNEINLAVGYKSDGTKDVDSFSTNSAYGSSYTTNDVIGIALDATSKTVTFYKNNVSQGAVSYTRTGNLTFFATGRGAATYAFVANFGQQPFSYTPPANFVALNTFNLPTPTIGATASTTANEYFDVTTYTGNGTTQSITNSGSMQPDWVWLKCRSTNYRNQLYDSVRGATKALFSDSTDAEGTFQGVTAFNANGFSLGAELGANASGDTFVGWQWRASNATAVTNTDGSITSTVSANTTAGFSIVSFNSGAAGDSTVGHGLGVTPSVVIMKSRQDSSYNWAIYHSSVCTTTSNYFTFTSSGLNTYATVWGAALPTSTVFGITSGNGNGGIFNNTNCIAYCFAPIAGYSAFGSYTGNGSTDGPFVFTGFRPRFVMFKGSSIASNWCMLDSARNTYNLTDATLQANSSAAELTNLSDVDFLSNGIKIRDVVTNDTNVSGQTYIYMAFAENPFKYANAR